MVWVASPDSRSTFSATLSPKPLVHRKSELFSEPFDTDLPSRCGGLLAVQTLGERLVDLGGLFANFDTTSIRRRAFPYRYHCSGSLGSRGAVGRTLDLRPARHHKAPDVYGVKGTC